MPTVCFSWTAMQGEVGSCPLTVQSHETTTAGDPNESFASYLVRVQTRRWSSRNNRFSSPPRSIYFACLSSNGTNEVANYVLLAYHLSDICPIHSSYISSLIAMTFLFSRMKSTAKKLTRAVRRVSRRRDQTSRSVAVWPPPPWSISPTPTRDYRLVYLDLWPRETVANHPRPAPHPRRSLDGIVSQPPRLRETETRQDPNCLQVPTNPRAWVLLTSLPQTPPSTGSLERPKDLPPPYSVRDPGSFERLEDGTEDHHDNPSTEYRTVPHPAESQFVPVPVHFGPSRPPLATAIKGPSCSRTFTEDERNVAIERMIRRFGARDCRNNQHLDLNRTPSIVQEPIRPTVSIVRSQSALSLMTIPFFEYLPFSCSVAGDPREEEEEEQIFTAVQRMFGLPVTEHGTNGDERE